MSFDPLARHYGWMEWLLAGHKLQRCRTTFLDRVEGVRNVLIAGEGNGRFLTECRSKLPDARIIVVDASAGMLRAARERLTRRGLDPGGVGFIHTDALVWQPEAQAFDLIVTHFFLDCFPPEELKQVIANLASAAAPGATWLLADFHMPASLLPRCRARTIHAMMYAFFRLATRIAACRLTLPEDFLGAHNFALLERRTSDWGLLHTDIWARPRRYPSALATDTSARSKSCNVISPSILPFGESSNTTISAVDSINRD
jgi:ubiquinone/menaquinone biosynthesis C-methylase UbiE